MANNFNRELLTVGQQIGEQEKQLSAFDNPSAYLNLLKNVADASYRSNKDLISFRQEARRQLYGEEGYKPTDYYRLSPEQQATIRGSSRAGLTAAIQASQETEAARGRRVESLLAAEGARIGDVRESLSSSLNRLYSRRGQLEQTKQQTESEARNFFFDLVKNYPDLVRSLTPQEQNKLFAGRADEKLMDKVSLYAKQREAQERIKTIEKDGFIVGIDPQTGREAFRIDLGPAFRDKVGGAGTADERLLAQFNRLPQGFEVRPQQGQFGGVDFYVPYDRKNLPRRGKVSMIGGQKLIKVTGADWQNALKNRGISFSYKTAESIVNPPAQAAVDKRDDPFWAYVEDMRASGYDEDQIKSSIRESGRNPEDYGY